MQKVRVRFAPSPTGYLHVGGARTALYNYLYAKRNGGEFILRIEDTDEARSTEESLKMVIHDLKWLGLTWDEGPHPETLEDMGPVGPYKQSRRQDIYQDVAQELLQQGKAYYCFMTDAEIEEQKKAAEVAGTHAHVQSPYESWSLEKALEHKNKGNKAVVRFKTRALKKDYVLQDLVRGEVSFPSDMVGDFVLLRSDGMPVYNFCCVVDDHLMKISHILRAEEHLSNSLRQMMIYEGMGWTLPQFGHISLVLDEDRQKMSKRRGATSCFQFKEDGYLPEAILNFIALLGWSHPEGKEIVSVEEMKNTFSVDRLNSSGAVFDRVKLKWMNAQYLRALSDEALWAHTEPFLKKAGLSLPYGDTKWAYQSLQTFKTYMETFMDAVPFYASLDDSKFEKWSELLFSHSGDTFTEAEFMKMQDDVKNATGAKGKNLFQAVRVAVIGKPHGTELKLLVPLMTKNSLIHRAKATLKKLG